MRASKLIGKNIKKALRIQGITIRNLAKQLSMSYQNLYGILDGRIRMTLDTAVDTAQFLNMSLDELYGLATIETRGSFSYDSDEIHGTGPETLEETALDQIINAPPSFYKQLAERINPYLPTPPVKKRKAKKGKKAGKETT